MTWLFGASTAAHQVEGNNKQSDFWILENLPHSDFAEPSLDAVDHYHRYQEDIDLMAQAGLNAYRFSIEWARIEPLEGQFDEGELQHYRDVIAYCRAKGIEPVVTLHHFTSPAWLIPQGGWEAETTIDKFAAYVRYVIEGLGQDLNYVCTINEANMGLQIAAITKRILKQMGIDLQVGMNFSLGPDQAAKEEAIQEAFGLNPGESPQTFLSQRSEKGDQIICRAHQAARAVIRELCPHIKVGLTLSLHDIQVVGGEPAQKLAEEEWNQEFSHYLPYIEEDDFLGVQNYTRSLIGDQGIEKVPAGSRLTQMNYEDYPQALGNVIRKVARDFHKEILITENGIATADDAQRQAFIKEALEGVKAVKAEGIPVIGYLHWTLLDNFEWHKGFGMTFGLIAVDRETQARYPKDSLKVLGEWANEF